MIIALMVWKVAGNYGLDRFILLTMIAQIERYTAKRGKRIEAVSVPNMSSPALTTALSLDELHGFE